MTNERNKTEFTIGQITCLSRKLFNIALSALKETRTLGPTKTRSRIRNRNRNGYPYTCYNNCTKEPTSI